jgi:antitoxin component YwqK of YwqJK toxin-antitoxin module
MTTPGPRCTHAGWFGLLLLAFALASCSDTVVQAWPQGTRRFEGSGSPGNEEGEWTYRYEDGRIRAQGEYSNGHKEGVWTEWHPIGQIASRGERVLCTETGADEREGSWTFWNESGVKHAQGAYLCGLRQGPWTFWKGTGDLNPVKTGEYEGGVKVR